MCTSPSVNMPTQPQAIRYQQSKEPVMREKSSTAGKKTGRRGTIIAPSSAPTDVSVAGKKTALGA